MSNVSFFSILDYFYIFLMLISTLLGAVKGFTRVFFSICAWIVSGFLSVMLSPYVLKLIGHFFQRNHIAKAVSAILSYVVILAVLLIITHMISDGVKHSVLSELDRACGALFGLVRGLLFPFFVCMIFIILNINYNNFTIVKESKISRILFEISPLMFPNLEKSDVVRTIRDKHKSLCRSIGHTKTVAGQLINSN